MGQFNSEPKGRTQLPSGPDRGAGPSPASAAHTTAHLTPTLCYSGPHGSLPTRLWLAPREASWVCVEDSGAGRRVCVEYPPSHWAWSCCTWPPLKPILVEAPATSHPCDHGHPCVCSQAGPGPAALASTHAP